MSAKSYGELRHHIGHEVEVVCYGEQGEDPANVAIECVTCSEVLVDYDNPCASRKTAERKSKEKQLATEKKKVCEDCGETFLESEGRPYKYEKAVWLCDDCHDRRMEEDDDE